MPAQIGMLAGANAHTRNMAGTGSPVSGCSTAPVRVRACQSSASVASPRLPSRKACSFALAASICESLQHSSCQTESGSSRGPWRAQRTLFECHARRRSRGQRVPREEVRWVRQSVKVPRAPDPRRVVKLRTIHSESRLWRHCEKDVAGSTHSEQRAKSEYRWRKRVPAFLGQGGVAVPGVEQWGWSQRAGAGAGSSCSLLPPSSGQLSWLCSAPPHGHGAS